MNKKALIAQVEANVKNCSKCRLCKTALNAVPGEGNIESKIVFIGEAPGATEDKTGRPFVGRAGNLLETLLKEIGYKREDVWIGNIIKHRPPDNRDPLPDEIKACEGYLAMQLSAINPWVVVTLGRFSMNYFYKEGKITKDHGHPRKVGDIVLYPVYHPAAALRNTSFADALRKDFKRIPKLMDYLDKKDYGKKSSNNNFQVLNEATEGQLGLDF